MDWNMCCVCQKNSRESLKCPLNVNGRGDKLESYSTFIDNVSTFRAYNALPVALNFGEHSTISDLVNNKALWHKSFHNKFSSNKVERLMKKRGKDETRETGGYVVKRNRDSEWKRWLTYFVRKKVVNSMNLELLWQTSICNVSRAQI